MSHGKCQPFCYTEGSVALCYHLGRIQEIIEVIPAGISSLVTLEYTLNVESPQRAAFNQHDQAVVLRLIRQPSPSLMLISCLVLGCSISSFVYRRQAQDPYQLAVFLVLIAWAVAVGYATGASANLILLGFVPWAVCASMAMSYCGHCLIRWLQSRAVQRRRESEKHGLLD